MSIRLLGGGIYSPRIRGQGYKIGPISMCICLSVNERSHSQAFRSRIAIDVDHLTRPS